MTDYLSRAELVHIAQAALVDRFGPVPTPGAFAVVDVVVDALHEVGALPMGVVSAPRPIAGHCVDIDGYAWHDGCEHCSPVVPASAPRSTDAANPPPADERHPDGAVA